MPNELKCDVAVIGAGTAGLAAERAARQFGKKTRLIDDRFAGTTCATVGCMPSKLLIAAADAAHAVRRAGIFGIKASPPIVRGAAVLARMQRERVRFVASAQESFDQLPDGVRIRARARFIDRTTLALSDGRRVVANGIVIATGASTSIPKTFDDVRRLVLTNDTIFDLDDLPASIGVVGAGPLGLELAQALSRLGVDVMVFDEADRLAGLSDVVVMKELQTILTKEFPIMLGVKLMAVAEGEGVQISWSGATPGQQWFERLLLASGRPPQLADLQLTNAQIALDEHGVPVYDRCTMQCGDSPIFVAGDANHERAVLHEAASEGAIAGRNAAAYPAVASGKRFVPLSIMFTDPPVSVIGDVPKPGDSNTVTGVASYHDQGRAKIFARNAGIANLYADKRSGVLTGAAMVGPGVEHSAHLIAWAIQRKMTATEMLDLPFYHPTYEEGLKPALRAICGRMLGCLLVIALALWQAPTACAQTPSPLQEWQYSGGLILAKLFAPDLPRFRTILGLASEVEPVYDGSRAYHVQGGPVINVQYEDAAFLATGDGIGYNFFRGDHYQIGASLVYDLGRKVRDDYANLRGMGNISAAPVAKIFGTAVLSKKFPLILRVDVRQFAGGDEGAIGDAGLYMPLPGSSRSFVMFAGPSITLATHHYLQTVYGVTPEQSLASGHPIYEVPHAGTSAAGVGFSATKFVTTHWLFNLDAAINQIRGSAGNSPLVEKRTQRVLALSVDYQF